MAKTQPSKSSQRKKKRPKPQSQDPQTLLSTALTLLQTNPDPTAALRPATQALDLLSTPSSSPHAAFPALTLLAQIHLALGDPEQAFQHYKRAAATFSDDDDDDQEDDGADAAETYLWLAQLDPEGGEASARWFERGEEVLRRAIAQNTNRGKEEVQEGLKAQLAQALCAHAEVYMTDLSLEPNAETRCEALVTEALLLAPHDPAPLQTLASVRISQLRMEEAKGLLRQSLGLWQGVDDDEEETDSEVPEFASRVSLVRLLLETELVEEALGVCEGLVKEDDESVEVWYLGGWGWYLKGEGDKGKEYAEKMLREARRWLKMALGLYDNGGSEDERLREHAMELMGELDSKLGVEVEEEENGWEDEDDDGEDGEDEEMADGV